MIGDNESTVISDFWNNHFEFTDASTPIKKKECWNFFNTLHGCQSNYHSFTSISGRIGIRSKNMKKKKKLFLITPTSREGKLFFKNCESKEDGDDMKMKGETGEGEDEDEEREGKDEDVGVYTADEDGEEEMVEEFIIIDEYIIEEVEEKDEDQENCEDDGKQSETVKINGSPKPGPSEWRNNPKEEEEEEEEEEVDLPTKKVDLSTKTLATTKEDAHHPSQTLNNHQQGRDFKRIKEYWSHFYNMSDDTDDWLTDEQVYSHFITTPFHYKEKIIDFKRHTGNITSVASKPTNNKGRLYKISRAFKPYACASKFVQQEIYIESTKQITPAHHPQTDSQERHTQQRQ